MNTLVSLLLVLAIDVSDSVSPERFELQVRGTAEAFRHERVIEAIQHTPEGCIGVSVVQWSGEGHAEVSVPWHTICRREEALAFADAVEGIERKFSDFTSISHAIDYSVRLIETAPFHATRKAIDVSGDGSNNNGRPVAEARSAAEAAGITVNGLAIVGPHESEIGRYYRENVQTWDGFTVITTWETFLGAILAKILTEIA